VGCSPDWPNSILPLFVTLAATATKEPFSPQQALQTLTYLSTNIALPYQSKQQNNKIVETTKTTKTQQNQSTQNTQKQMA